MAAVYAADHSVSDGLIDMEHRLCRADCRPQKPHQFQDMTGCDIIKRGTLYVKNPPSSKPAAFNIHPWKKRYVVLRDTWFGPCVTTSLDLYDNQPPSFIQLDGGGGPLCVVIGRSEPYSVDLGDVMAVGFHLESRRFQFTFFVQRCDGSALLFAADSDLEMRCWVAALRTLADKARVGMMNSRKPVRATSTPESDNCCQRCSGPSVDLAVPLSVQRRWLNLSDSQLRGGVSGGLHRYVQSPSPPAGQHCKLNDPNVGRLRRSQTSFMSSLNEVDTDTLSSHSPGGCHSLRRIFSASMFCTVLRGDLGPGGRRWRAFSKDRRKDSGFSDSFEEATSTGDSGTDPSTPNQLSVDGQDAAVTTPPPPRPPPRRVTVVDERPFTLLSLRDPPPPPLDDISVQQDELDRPEPVPPTPPPRPLHTLFTFGSSCTDCEL